MNIAIFHNYYSQAGGEDQMYELEIKTLSELGHNVFPFSLHNEDELSNASKYKKLKLAWTAAYNQKRREEIRDFLDTNEIDIGHVHNWFPLFSPSIYHAHQDLGIPVVQTLHNYRLGCANGTFRRAGKECLACLEGTRSQAVTNKCYRNSLVGSLSWKRLADNGWKKGIFATAVDAYVSPSATVANRHIELGLPPSKVHVIPNAVPQIECSASHAGKTATFDGLFLGRLTAEKGVDLLIESWPKNGPSLAIAGSGPEESKLREQAKSNPRIRLLGHIDRKAVEKAVRSTRFLVFPSRWAEPFGLSIIEAMSAGIPVIAFKHGAPSEIIEHGKNGLLVPVDDTAALSKAISDLHDNPDFRDRLGANARLSYLSKYQPYSHGRSLLKLFASLVKAKTKSSSSQLACANS